MRSLIVPPSPWARYRARKRLTSIPAQLAQDLEVLASALRSGCSFVQAIQIAAREGSPPIAEEWMALLKDVQLGASLGAALESLENRLPIAAIRSFAITARITQETGGNLSGVLLTLADTLRQEIAFQGRLRAMTAQGKLSSYVISALPFLLTAVLYVIAPELITPLFTTGLGQMLIGAALVMLALGTLMVQKIVTIEV